VVLSDAPIPPDSTEALDQQAYWGINVTHVEAALAHLLGEGQEVSEGAHGGGGVGGGCQVAMRLVWDHTGTQGIGRGGQEVGGRRHWH